jgi:hypothetical protein
MLESTPGVCVLACPCMEGGKGVAHGGEGGLGAFLAAKLPCMCGVQSMMSDKEGRCMGKFLATFGKSREQTLIM